MRYKVPVYLASQEDHRDQPYYKVSGGIFNGLMMTVGNELGEWLRTSGVVAKFEPNQDGWADDRELALRIPDPNHQILFKLRWGHEFRFLG